jgi:hypothetical protein
MCTGFWHEHESDVGMSHAGASLFPRIPLCNILEKIRRVITAGKRVPSSAFRFFLLNFPGAASMKVKVRVLAMAACTGLSFSAFAQTQADNPAGRDASAGSGQAERSMQERAYSQERMYSGRAGDGSQCRGMRGSEQRRCLEADASASHGAIPLTQQPGASGPGAVDKTHPGSETHGFSGSPRDAGTSSAGSGT